MIMQSLGLLRRIRFDLAALAILLASYALCLYLFPIIDLGDGTGDGIRWTVLAVSLTPLLLAYAVLRLFSPAMFSGVLVSVAAGVVSIAHSRKMALTNDPLSWNDLATTAHISVIREYVTPGHVAFLGLSLAALAFFLWLDPPEKPARKRILFWGAICLCLAPVALYPYTWGNRSAPALALNRIIKQAGVLYISWDWEGNVRRNGLFMHLVQTSRRHMPGAATPEQKQWFGGLENREPAADSPARIIFVLCEACWYDKAHFSDAFAPLARSGFREMRGISPVYGGGTPNASFEMLTGLPAQSRVLNGVIYQEYASVISERSHTVASHLKRRGYRTFAAHNYNRKFWQRHIVFPKFGFDDYVALEEMHYDGEPGFPDDKILFDAALKKIDSDPGEKIFMHLVTVSSHGPYASRGDYGESVYREKMSRAAERIAEFVARVRQLPGDSLILVYGDHKPAMTKYFAERGVFPASTFIRTGSTDADYQFAPSTSHALLGDVPMLVWHPDGERVDRFVREADGLPFFCVAQKLDATFLHSGVPAFQYIDAAVCRNYRTSTYKDAVERVPEWLYSESLFNS